MKIAAVTMVYKDYDFLNLWVNYYGEIFGRENLFVISHGEDAKVSAICAGTNVSFLSRNGLSPRFDRLRWDYLSAFVNFQLLSYDAVICSDVDELLYVDPRCNESLISKIAAYKSRTTISGLGLEVFQSQDEMDWRSDKWVLNDRKMAVPSVSYSKPVVALNDVRYMPGGHATPNDPYIPKDLYLLHLKYVSKDLSYQSLESRKQDIEASADNSNFASAVHTAWIRGGKWTDKFYRQIENYPIHDLDSKVNDIRASLNSSITNHSRFRKMRVFEGSGVEAMRILLPPEFNTQVS